METFVPTYKEVRPYSDRIKQVDASLFPGYIFCRTDIEHRLPILTTPGVEYFVSYERIPEPIPDQEIEAIMRVVRDGQVKPWPYLKQGDRVRVKAGAFTAWKGFSSPKRGRTAWCCP